MLRVEIAITTITRFQAVLTVTHNARDPLHSGSLIHTDKFYRVAATLAAASAAGAAATLAGALTECFVKAALAAINGQ